LQQLRSIVAMAFTVTRKGSQIASERLESAPERTIRIAIDAP
jgi:hypothetical protein